jgi:hypothetical protein
MKGKGGKLSHKGLNTQPLIILLSTKTVCYTTWDTTGPLFLTPTNARTFHWVTYIATPSLFAHCLFEMCKLLYGSPEVAVLILVNHHIYLVYMLNTIPKNVDESLMCLLQIGL